MVVFIWTGRGFWTALFTILALGVIGLTVSMTWGEATLDANRWLYGVALVVAALLNWSYGRRWNGTTGRGLWDARPSFRWKTRRPHRVFALPMELWSLPMVLAGLWIILTSVVFPHR